MSTTARAAEASESTDDTFWWVAACPFTVKALAVHHRPAADSMTLYHTRHFTTADHPQDKLTTQYFSRDKQWDAHSPGSFETVTI